MFIKPHGYKIVLNGVVIDWAPRKEEAKRKVKRFADSKGLPVDSFKVVKVIS